MKKVLSLFLCFFTTLMLQAQCGIIDALCYDNDDTEGDLLVTLCPDFSTEIIELNINSLELHTGDILNIYEGEDISGPLLASYEGAAEVLLFENQTITVNATNTCLTLDFVSNGFISCVDGTTALGTDIEVLGLNFSTNCSCPQPTASFTMDQSEFCLDSDATVTFDATASSGQNGAAIVEYAWSFDDGISGFGPIVSHTYLSSEGTGFSPSLVVTDENGCESQAVIGFVIVSGSPEILIVIPLDPVCPNSSFNVNTFPEGGGFSWSPEILTIEAIVPNEDEFVCSELVIDLPFAGETLACAGDMQVSIDIEHNWVGDIGIWLISPDGTIVTLHESNAGDIDTNPFLSCEPTTVVSATAQGDILAEPQNLNGEYVFVSPINDPDIQTLEDVLVDNPGSNSIIPPGMYQSASSLVNLQGSPINGTWTLIVQDFWACGPFSDIPPCATPDAFPIANIENWSIQFGDCDLGFDIKQDSLYYLLDGESVGSANGGSTTIDSPSEGGTYEYQVVYVDEFGCEYSETFLVEVLPVDDEICGGESPNIAELELSVFFEGTYDAATGEMNTDLEAYIPDQQPYNIAPYFYEGNETIIPFLAGIVDWVLVEIREGTPSLTEQNTTVLKRKAGLLMATGEIIDAETGFLIEVEDLVIGTPYHICIRHRNHLDILSANPVALDSSGNKILTYDFTNSAESVFGLEQVKDLGNNAFGMFAADFVAEGIIQTTDYDEWFFNPAVVGVYAATDANLDGIVQTTDFDLWFANKAKVGTPEVRFE